MALVRLLYRGGGGRQMNDIALQRITLDKYDILGGQLYDSSTGWGNMAWVHPVLNSPSI